jgi:replicative DNA helicase
MLVQMVKEIARQGTHVGVISIEMTKEELTFRAAAQDAGVDSSRIEDNTITDGERAHIHSVIRQNKAIYERIHVIDDSYVTNEQLPAKYNELIANYGCEVIALDYLQRVGMSGKNNGKVDIVTATSETITAITKSTGVATIALSTLNEDHSAFDGAGQGKRKKKGLNNLKNARQIGHDASTVVILTMQEGDGLPEDEKHIVVQSVKNRKGGYFCVPLLFHGPTQRFTDDGSEVEG